jgi:hypothetical protein
LGNVNIDNWYEFVPEMTATYLSLGFSGRFELLNYIYICKSCGLKQDPFDFFTVLKSGYWPSSPRKLAV